MNLGFLVQERPARNALTVEVNCVNRTRKRVPDAARFSAGPAFITSSAALEARISGSWKKARAQKCVTHQSGGSCFIVSQAGE